MHWWPFIIGLLIGYFILPMLLKMVGGSKSGG